MRNADTLHDINAMRIYHLHALSGKRNGQYALDIGNRSAYRLIIKPLNEDGKEFEETDIRIVYQSAHIKILEVSNHYESN